MLFALQLVRWMRRMVRDALQDQPPLALPDGRKLPAPSDAVILETLRPPMDPAPLEPRLARYQWCQVPLHMQRLLEVLGVLLYVRLEPI